MDSWGQTCIALNLPATKPAGEAVPNTEFFRRMAPRLGMKEKYLQDSDEQIIRTALKSDHPYLKGITYDTLLAKGWMPLSLPEPWLPFAKGNFPTPSKKCEFYSEKLMAAGLDPLPQYVPVKGEASGGTRYPLMLLTSKSARNYLNSSRAGLEHNLKSEGDPCLQIHKEDASARGIADGDMVRVFNQRGSVTVRAQVADRTRPRLVSMPHGCWASRMQGGSSANALTPDGLSDLGGGGDFHDTRVEVEKLS
jgi:anaerobic selenocysteine-containing dehydrogenase